MRSLLFAFALFFSWIGYAQEEVGTLLVTYQTGIKSERMDRIRFRIKSKNIEPQLHPKRGGFVDDRKSQTRMVAIKNLPAGEYTLEFLLPNKDGLFEEIPSREIMIAENKTVKIDQQIKPRYALLKVKLDYEPAFECEAHPQITLFDAKSNIVAQSTTGVLEDSCLLPQRYSLTFSPLDSYITPVPLQIDLNPKEESIKSVLYKKIDTIIN